MHIIDCTYVTKGAAIVATKTIEHIGPWSTSRLEHLPIEGYLAQHVREGTKYQDPCCPDFLAAIYSDHIVIEGIVANLRTVTGYDDEDINDIPIRFCPFCGEAIVLTRSAETETTDISAETVAKAQKRLEFHFNDRYTFKLIAPPEEGDQ